MEYKNGYSSSEQRRVENNFQRLKGKPQKGMPYHFIINLLIENIDKFNLLQGYIT